MQNAPALRRTLRANALFSLVTGLALVGLAGPLAGWLGVDRPQVLVGLGVVLLAFAGHLTWAARRRLVRVEALYFVASDALWVLGTVVLLLGFPAALSGPGKLAAALCALVVGVFAWRQARGLRTLDTGH